jgi:hypothetical protein
LRCGPQQENADTQRSAETQVTAMNLITRLFAPSYVKEVIASLDGLTTIFEEHFAASAAFNVEMKGRVKTWFLEHPEAVQRASQEPNYNPRVVCLEMIANLARDDLASGRDYGMNAENKKALYIVAMKELVKFGLGTPETLRDRTKELDQEMKEWE